jgi:hypothetical protein
MLRAMSDVPKLVPLSVAGGILVYPRSNENGDNTEEPEPRSRKARSRTSSPPPPRFSFNKDDSRTTWHRQATHEQNYIQLVVEREGFPNGAIIADRVDPRLLFKVAPALQKRLEGRRIFVPSVSCLDEETIESMVFSLLRCAKEGIPVPEPVEKKPVSMIMMHCVLVFFEMQKESQDTLAKLWDSFQQVKLSPMDVLWIWDTFSGRVQSEPYAAPFAHEYIQAMAWQLLNLDAIGLLDQDIRRLIELEKEPKYFTETMEARFKTHGLEKDPLVRNMTTEVPEVRQVIGTETPSYSTKAAIGVQKNESKPAVVAAQTGQASTSDKPKTSNLTSSKTIPGLRAPAFKPTALNSTLAPVGTPAPSITNAGPAATKFNFASASKPIMTNSEAASQNAAQAGAKRSVMFSGNAGEENQNKTGLNAPKTIAVPTGFGIRLGGTNAPMPTVPTTATNRPSTSSGIGISAPSQGPFSGFGQSPSSASTQATTQSDTTSNTVGFAWGRPGTAQPTASAPFQSTNSPGFFTPQPSQPVVGPFGGVNTPNVGIQTPPPNTLPSGFNLSGGATATSAGAPQHQQHNAGNMFSNSTSNAPFGTPGPNSSNNVGAFRVPSNNFAPNTPAPTNSGFALNNNAEGFSQQPNGIGGQFQQPNGSPFGSPFSTPANITGTGNNMFAFQGTPGGDAGGARSGAAGGGMVRKILKPTGAKRSRR